MPLISVILPFHREGYWLKDAVESIQEQSHRHLEILLIENGADTATREIAARFAKSDSRIRLLLEEKTGIAHALNKGLAHAQGEYIARMDADDYSLPERFTKQLQLLSECSAKHACFTQVAPMPGTQTGEGMQWFMDWTNTLLSAEDIRLNRFIDAPVIHPTLLAHRSLFDDLPEHYKDGVPEDYELWLRWMQSGIEMIKVPQALLRWRDHPDRLTRSHAHYAPDRFFEVKAKYLIRAVPAGTPVCICGADNSQKIKIQRLISAGMDVQFITDVRPRQMKGLTYLPVEQVGSKKSVFYISLVGARGKHRIMRNYLNGIGLAEGRDYLLAG